MFKSIESIQVSLVVNKKTGTKKLGTIYSRTQFELEEDLRTELTELTELNLKNEININF